MCHLDHQSKTNEQLFRSFSLPVKLEPGILDCFGGEEGGRETESVSLNHCGFWSCEQ